MSEKPVSLDIKIRFLKGQLKAAVIKYRQAREHLDCGANLAAVFSTKTCAFAVRVNKLAAELKEIDPNFPKNWQEYPTGN